MFDTPQFVTGPFTPRRVFLPDREYGLALDALVKGCSDVLIQCASGRKVLLGRRRVEPQPDWWFVGGRSRPGDTTTAAARRNVKRELGLDFDEGRFEVVANYSMVWSYREQEPTTNGTADLSTVHVLRLTEKEEEAGVPALDPKEYHESRWWQIEDILSDGDDRFHPCLVNAVKALKARAAYHKLERAASGGDGTEGAATEEDIAKHAVEFVRAMQQAKSAKRSVKVVFDEEASKYVHHDDNNDTKRQKVESKDGEEEKKSESSA